MRGAPEMRFFDEMAGSSRHATPRLRKGSERAHL